MKQAQAAGIRPLVPVDRKASAKAAKARLREKENAEYEAMQKGTGCAGKESLPSVIAVTISPSPYRYPLAPCPASKVMS